jgi:hypothetical protein
MGNIEDIKRPAVLPPQFRSAEDLDPDALQPSGQDDEPEPGLKQENREEIHPN